MSMLGRTGAGYFDTVGRTEASQLLQGASDNLGGGELHVWGRKSGLPGAR